MTLMIYLTKFIGILIWFLGGFDDLLSALIIFISTECISSVLLLFSLRQFSFKFIVQWIINKCMLFLLIGITNTIDSFLIENGESLRAIALWFYISHEGIIILNNSAKLGLPIPEKIINFIAEISTHFKGKDSGK